MRTCTDCGRWFDPPAAYPRVKRCYACWRQHKDREAANASAVVTLRYQVSGLNAQVRQLRESTAEFDRNLAALIRLAHPDKHGNSKAANEITQWLLDVRKRGGLGK